MKKSNKINTIEFLFLSDKKKIQEGNGTPKKKKKK